MPVYDSVLVDSENFKALVGTFNREGKIAFYLLKCVKNVKENNVMCFQPGR